MRKLYNEGYIPDAGLPGGIQSGLSKSHLLRHQGHTNADDIMLNGVHVVSCQHLCG